MSQPSPTSQTSQLPVRIRPARPEDKPAVMAISAQVWDGDDYLPHVWDTWLTDTAGRLSVVTLRGKIIAVGKLTRHRPGEWWLEGIRVDTRYRGRGIARLLHAHHVAVARETAPGTIRFATGAENRTMHRLGREDGFADVGHYRFVRAPALSRRERTAAQDAGTQTPPLETWRKDDLIDLERFFRRSARLRAASGLYMFTAGWIFFEFSLERLAAFVAARRAVGWRGANGAVVAVALVTPHARDGQLRVNFADARVRSGPLGLSDLAYALRDLAGRRRLKSVFADVPTAPASWERAWSRAGFQNPWPGEEVWVFEKGLK